MKLKILSTVCILLIASSARGQHPAILLSFTGISNEKYVQLSKIEIRNMRSNCDTTLFWPDTVLSINPLGINNLDLPTNELRIFQNVPNPVRQNTKVLLYLPKRGKVAIDVSLLTGKQVSLFSKELQHGLHSFLFTPGGNGIYVLTTICNGAKKSIKIVSLSERPSSECILTYTGAENDNTPLKPVEISGKFTFSVGDTLRVTGYYGTFATSFQDAPAMNKSYIFNFPTTGIYCPGIPAVTYMGQTYNTVQIGTQCWFRENLNVGVQINGNQEQTDNGIIEKYCYENDLGNCNTYGGLYQWSEMMKYSTIPGSKGICPQNWHLPTFGEWDTLKMFLGGISAGGTMKSTGTLESGTGLWNSPNAGATNASGFSALPAGHRFNDGLFYAKGIYCAWWSSSISFPDNGWIYYLQNDNENIQYWGMLMNRGHSVRCVYDF